MKGSLGPHSLSCSDLLQHHGTLCATLGALSADSLHPPQACDYHTVQSCDSYTRNPTVMILIPWNWGCVRVHILINLCHKAKYSWILDRELLADTVQYLTDGR